MSSADLVFYESDDSDASGPLTFSNIQTGTATSAQTVHLWNAKGSALAETATQIRVTALARGPLDTDYSVDALASAQRWVQMRAVDETGTGIAVQETAWTAVGKNRYLALDPIPTNCARYLEIRLDVPPGIGSATDLDVVLAMEWDRPAVPVSDGFTELYGDGVQLGLNDGTQSFIVSGGVLTESGSPDDNVNYTDIVYVHKGKPYVLLADAFNIDDTDGDAATLAGGEAYWDTLYLDDTGIQEAKGSKATSPLSAGTRPAVPEGGILLGYVQRDFDAAIATADIFQSTVYRGYFSLSTSNLTATIGPGRATVDNSLARFDQPTEVTLTDAVASLGQHIWLRSDGGYEATSTSARPDDNPQALLLYRVTTSGGAVTATQDCRRWIGGRIVPVTMQWVSSVDDEDYSLVTHYANGRSGFLLPVAPVVADVDDLGTGGASGSFKFDVEMSDSGGAFTTIFTSSGTVDRRASIAYNSSTLRDVSAVPEGVEVPPYARFRGRCKEVPGSISVAPAGARVTVLVVEV